MSSNGPSVGTPSDGAQLSAAAAECFLRLQAEDPSAAELQHWSDWLQRDPAHQAAVDEVARVWKDLDTVVPVMLPDAQAILKDERSDAFAEIDSVHDARAAHRSTRRSRLRWLSAGGALAAGVLLAIVLNRGYFALDVPHQRERLQTRVSQVDRLVLGDGSRLTLDGDSRVETDFSGKLRLVKLVRGRAFFEVAKDATRPFIVTADEGHAMAVGTAFEVNKLSDIVSVTVTEGVVKVTKSAERHATGPSSETLLEGGEQVSYSAHGTLQSVRRVDASQTGSWRSGMLVFVDEPLAHAIEEMNRFSSEPIQFEPEDVAGIRVSGTVDTTRIHEWLKGLEKGYPLKVVRNPRGLSLTRSAQRG